MKKVKQPQCYVVAGPNGAGKTTFAMKYLPMIVSCCDFINVDEIAKGLSPLNFKAGILLAGRLFIEALKQKIASRKDFAFETTLSGRSYLKQIPRWRKAGWNVTLFYLYIPNADFSAHRVHQRVIQGGHGIPREDILQCFPRSVKNFFDYSEVCDQVFCLDNTQSQIIPIFEKRFGGPFVIQDQERFEKLQGVLKNE